MSFQIVYLADFFVKFIFKYLRLLNFAKVTIHLKNKTDNRLILKGHPEVMINLNVHLSKHILHYQLEMMIFWQDNDQQVQNQLALISDYWFLSSCFMVLNHDEYIPIYEEFIMNLSFGDKLMRLFLFQIVYYFTQIYRLNFDQTFTL